MRSLLFSILTPLLYLSPCLLQADPTWFIPAQAIPGDSSLAVQNNVYVSSGASDTCLVTWLEHGTGEFYYQFFNGTEWGSATSIPGTVSDTIDASILTSTLIAPNTFIVTWRASSEPMAPYYLYYAIYDALNDTWPTNATRLTSGTSPISATDPFPCATTGGTIVLTWQDADSGNPYYSASSNSGATWSAAQAITDASQANGKIVSLGDTSGNIMAVWTDSSTSQPTYAIFDGSSWASPQAISGRTTNNDVFLSINSNNNQFMATWPDSISNLPYFAIYSGGSWSSSYAIDGAEAVDGQVTTSADSSGDFMVTWLDQGTTIPTYSIFNSIDWTTPQAIPSAAAAVVTPYSTFSSSGNILVFWGNSGDDVPYYAVYGLAPISPASHFQGGRVINHFGVVKESYNQLFWQASPSDILGYHLYRNEVLLATLSSDTLYYEDHNRQPGQSDSYTLDAYGDSSTSTTVSFDIGGN